MKKDFKKELRKQARIIRSELDISYISRQIVENIRKENFYNDAKNILAYCPFGDEVDITALFEDKYKNWFLPRLEFSSKSLYFHKYNITDSLVVNEFGIPEPLKDTEYADLSIIDLVFIPALAVDNKGYRLGYGAGFYDRFLSHINSEVFKVTPLPLELFYEKIPSDSWDIPVNAVATEHKVIWIK